MKTSIKIKSLLAILFTTLSLSSLGQNTIQYSQVIDSKTHELVKIAYIPSNPEVGYPTIFLRIEFHRTLMQSKFGLWGQNIRCSDFRDIQEGKPMMCIISTLQEPKIAIKGTLYPFDTNYIDMGQIGSYPINKYPLFQPGIKESDVQYHTYTFDLSQLKWSN